MMACLAMSARLLHSAHHVGLVSHGDSQQCPSEIPSYRELPPPPPICTHYYPIDVHTMQFVVQRLKSLRSRLRLRLLTVHWITCQLTSQTMQQHSSHRRDPRLLTESGVSPTTASLVHLPCCFCFAVADAVAVSAAVADAAVAAAAAVPFAAAVAVVVVAAAMAVAAAMVVAAAAAAAAAAAGTHCLRSPVQCLTQHSHC